MAWGALTPKPAPSLGFGSGPCTAIWVGIGPPARKIFMSPSELYITGNPAKTTSRMRPIGCCACSTGWNCPGRPGMAGASSAVCSTRPRDGPSRARMGPGGRCSFAKRRCSWSWRVRQTGTAAGGTVCRTRQRPGLSQYQQLAGMVMSPRHLISRAISD